MEKTDFWFERNIQELHLLASHVGLYMFVHKKSDKSQELQDVEGAIAQLEASIASYQRASIG